MRNAQGNCRWAAVTIAAISMVLGAAITAPAQGFATLVSFDGLNGAEPYFVLLSQGADGNLYGTTAFGGSSSYGTVFKMTPSGTLTTIYSFCAESNCTDGATPYAGLTLGTDGNFYGTTVQGGVNDTCTSTGFVGCGTIFRISPTGTLTTIHSFDNTDGANPFAAVVQGADGNFYGTTYAGGTYNYGTIFKMTPAGALTTIHNFDNGDGYIPIAGLIQGTTGNFYGTAYDGGSNGFGTVFEITPAGALATLYNFCSQSNCVDGLWPMAGLSEGPDGNFYGTTIGGGANGDGTVFKITPGGTLTTLHSFDGNDGTYPEGGLLWAKDGNFYGTAYLGGSPSCSLPDGCGTVYRITPKGNLTTLHTFNLNDGGGPRRLVQDTNGILYGTTYFGGAGNGTVFALSVGLSPFVETVPSFGKLGQSVVILGTNLKGTTSISFNGTPASFTIESATAIKTTVPTGATTGPVQVVTPNGTLTSNVDFRVLP